MSKKIYLNSLALLFVSTIALTGCNDETAQEDISDPQEEEIAENEDQNDSEVEGQDDEFVEDTEEESDDEELAEEAEDETDLIFGNQENVV